MFAIKDLRSGQYWSGWCWTASEAHAEGFGTREEAEAEAEEIGHCVVVNHPQPRE